MSIKYKETRKKMMMHFYCYVMSCIMILRLGPTQAAADINNNPQIVSDRQAAQGKNKITI